MLRPAALGRRLLPVVSLCIATTIAVRASAQPDARPPFDQWLTTVRSEALTRGIRETTVDQAFAGLEPLPVVLERDRSQAEVTLTLGEYLRRRLTGPMIRTGREMAARHRTVLSRVTETFGVPQQVIVAIWGLESNFGGFSGTRPTIAALATLAYDQRRATRFREELFQALEILDRGDVELDRMKGSWAGAMGQPQFLPSSFQRHAIDFDGDGRRNIWTSHADVFASIANYLKAYGWSRDLLWGRTVRVPETALANIDQIAKRRDGDCAAARQMTERLPLARWRQFGVTRADGAALPDAAVEASLLQADGRSFLVYRNYDALLAYNCAHTYGLSVALLADRIR
jgi:membrane-bound lytic murein transglycosylase B